MNSTRAAAEKEFCTKYCQAKYRQAPSKWLMHWRTSKHQARIATFAPELQGSDSILSFLEEMNQHEEEDDRNSNDGNKLHSL
jgi:hypothetical protein